MSGLRFCMLTTFYPPFSFGGDAIAVERLARALVRRGHHVTVVHDVEAHATLAPGPVSVGVRKADGVEVIGLRSGLGTLSAVLTHQLGHPGLNVRPIRRILDTGGFDVINFHNVSLLGGPALLSMGRAIKLYMAHEHWLVCPTHVLWRHRREICTGRQCIRCTLRHGRPPQLWRYAGLLEHRLATVDAVIAMSEFSRAKHAEFGFARPMEVLPYFAPDPDGDAVDDYAKAPYPKPYFLFVGRLERLKGLADVLPLFGADADADLLVAGDGAERPTLTRLAAGSPRVTFLGRVDPDVLPRYFRHAIALVVPSVGYETFGIVLIEAFREGTPVIARRLGPFPEIVERCAGGELFDDADGLRAAMWRMQHEPGHRERLAKGAHEGFVAHWSESAVVPRYLDLIRRLAEAKGHGRVAQALAARAREASGADRPHA